MNAPGEQGPDILKVDTIKGESRGSLSRLARARHFLFDLDGCIWFGANLAPGAAELTAELRARGRGVFFLTNGSAQPGAAVAAKLTRLGVPAAPEQVMTPLDVLPKHPALAGHKRLLVLGSPELSRTLEQAGFEVAAEPHGATAVVLGRMPDLTYRDLEAATRVLWRGGALVALNLDARVPLADGEVMPGVGAVAAALEMAGGVRAELVGKPSSFFFEAALQRFEVEANEAVMVGDSPDTDILGGSRAGLATVLVGAASLDTGLRPDSVAADLVVPDLPALQAHLTAVSAGVAGR